MARSPSAVLKNGKSSKAVKKAEKLKDLNVGLKSLDKEIARLTKLREKQLVKIFKLEPKKVISQSDTDILTPGYGTLSEEVVAA